MEYNHQDIELKWQNYWRENQTFKAENNSKKPKYYILDMFPYPSGSGLHVGHPLGYIASDIYARYKRHKGFNVLHPMGYDSFGLPAEQYAIQTGQHPAITTTENIKQYRSQMDRIGLSFDWSREIRTSNPDYYKWTQWIFTELFNSWYDKKEDKVKPIKDLKLCFEKNGNNNIDATCDEDVPVFSAKTWHQFSSEEKQNILLKYRMTFLEDAEVNWCPELGTVLANDEIVNGVSGRGGYPVIRKKMTQWSMRITAYAERLLKGLENIDWPKSLKDSQKYWIGKSVGTKVFFPVKNSDRKIEVFTTRVDTIFGVTFLTLAPELDWVSELVTIDQKDVVEKYIEQTAKRNEVDRMSDIKNISGVFTGSYAQHPLTGKNIPIWLGDYVLASYGTGSVMAVPCGDQRDYNYAKHFNLPIINIFDGVDISEQSYSDKENVKLTNSLEFDGLDCKTAIDEIVKALEAKKMGASKINYRLRNAVFSRQRYWGEPFPIYYKNNLPQLISKEHLPITLPEVKNYLPTKTGKPPLGNATIWAWDTIKNKVVENTKIDNKKVFPLELNTMPSWAGSSWYFNRYMNTDNDTEFVSKEAVNYWKEIDLYLGGSEHATGHLLYARFWQKFLFDRGYLPVDEFAKKLINQGMILGESAFIDKDSRSNIFYSQGKTKSENTIPIHVDISMVNTQNELDINAFKNWRNEYQNAEFITEKDGKCIVRREVEKMSKSKFNIVNPDQICKEYGADTLRLYEMFLGPLEQSKPWNMAGISGVYSFLKKMWKLYFDEDNFLVADDKPSKDNLKTLHKTIKKITEDIKKFSFNTSVSTFMICINELTAQRCKSRSILEPLVIILSPYAPHIAEELWLHLGYSNGISEVKFPICDEIHLLETTKEYPVSFNGRVRFKVEYPANITVQEIEKLIISHPKTKDYLQGRKPKRIIVVPQKIINIVG